MADIRTRRQKLEAMARDTSSPNEAAIARRLLADLKGGVEPTPPRRPQDIPWRDLRRAQQEMGDAAADLESQLREMERIIDGFDLDLFMRYYRAEEQKRGRAPEPVTFTRWTPDGRPIRDTRT